MRAIQDHCIGDRRVCLCVRLMAADVLAERSPRHVH